MNKGSMRKSIKRTYLTFWLFSFLALMPMSCGLFCTDSCGCGPSPPLKNLVVKSFEAETINADGQQIQPTLSQPYNQVFKVIRIKDFEYVSLNTFDFFEPWNLGTAFACSPIPPSTKNTLYLIQILNQKEITLGNGTKFELGEDISSYFGMSHFYGPNLISISNFIGPGIKMIQEDNFKIGFLKDPEKEINLGFTIRLVFDNGEEFLLENQIHSIK